MKAFSVRSKDRLFQSYFDQFNDNLSGDFIAQDVRQTIYYLSPITGDIPTPEILQTIFSRFCIGK